MPNDSIPERYVPPRPNDRVRRRYSLGDGRVLGEDEDTGAPVIVSASDGDEALPNVTPQSAAEVVARHRNPNNRDTAPLDADSLMADAKAIGAKIQSDLAPYQPKKPAPTPVTRRPKLTGIDRPPADPSVIAGMADELRGDQQGMAAADSMPPMLRGVMGAAQPKSPAPPDPADELRAAQGQASRNRLGASLLRAGLTAAEGISGSHLDKGGADEMMRRAGQPVTDFNQRQDFADQQHARQRRGVVEGREDTQYGRAEAARQAKSDPASPESEAYRAALATINPAIAQKLGNASAAQIESVLPTITKSREFQIEADKVRSAAADRALRREELGLQRTETDVQKLGKDAEGLNQVAADVKLLEGYANSQGDIPGAGVMDSRLPGVLQSQKDTEVQQAASRVAARLLHEISGAAVTPSEAERFMAGRGLGPGATEQQWRQGVRALTSELRSALQSKEAKYRPEVVKTLRDRGGLPSLGGGGAGRPSRTVNGETRYWNGSAWVKE